ncbi:cyclin-dependent kinase 14-like [Dendronephthya gigantea]|uniref:cyclin-dependent kinase 14-like n=1 Tax=Dendronephthya gigantea TaxID=151771 RepID=UPI00106C6099|nr:cyclin-dependent kinase 14-like [Dendronephthya gigantea]
MFKLPQLSKVKQAKKSTSILNGLPTFDVGELNIHDEIGRGSFSTVSVASNKTNSKCSVVKLLHNMEDEEKDFFFKEARLLNACKHENVVNVHGICMSPAVLLFDYVYFDFKPFEMDKKVSTLKAFLKEVDENIWLEAFARIVPVVAIEVAKGLSYLHENGIVHRDIKPDNILVSNQHYNEIKDEAMLRNVGRTLQ